MDDLLTTKQAAKELDVHINTLWKYLLSGKLKGFKRGGNGKSKHHWFIHRADLETFMAGTGARNTGSQADSVKEPDSGLPQPPSTQPSIDEVEK